jgi:hypothetical protein
MGDSVSLPSPGSFTVRISALLCASAVNLLHDSLPQRRRGAQRSSLCSREYIQNVCNSFRGGPVSGDAGIIVALRRTSNAEHLFTSEKQNRTRRLVYENPTKLGGSVVPGVRR